jgi:subtilisin family serine protease
MNELTDYLWPTQAELHHAVRQGTGRGIRVAVLDSGIATSHEALAGNSLRDDLIFLPSSDEFSVNTIEGSGQDDYGHGTAVAWLIWSLAPEVEIGSFRILAAENRNSKQLLVHQAAMTAIDRGYDILHCSFGHRAAAVYALDYKSWIDAAYVANRHIVAACDNAGSKASVFPAHFNSVIGVNRMAGVAEDALFRHAGNLVEFLALGENVRVPWAGGSWKTVIGTSFAAPRVTALAARVLGMFPNLTAAQMKAVLQGLARPLAVA